MQRTVFHVNSPAHWHNVPMLRAGDKLLPAERNPFTQFFDEPAIVQSAPGQEGRAQGIPMVTLGPV